MMKYVILIVRVFMSILLLLSADHTNSHISTHSSPTVLSSDRADMARLLHLDPSIASLTLEIGDDRVHVARDWPGDQYEEADRLIDRIVASGVCAIVVH